MIEMLQNETSINLLMSLFTPYVTSNYDTGGIVPLS